MPCKHNWWLRDERSWQAQCRYTLNEEEGSTRFCSRPYLLASILLLLAAMFLSFYLRRYGLRGLELGMAVVMAFYFSFLFGATRDTALWSAIGALVGIASAYVWQFVILPFDPVRSIHACSTTPGPASGSRPSWR